MPESAPPPVTGHEAVSHAVLRDRRHDMLVGRYDPSAPYVRDWLAARDAAAREHLDTLLAGPGRTALWPDLPLGGRSSALCASADRLRRIALARATPGSPLAGSQRAADTVRDGLAWLLERHYGTVETYDNWWDWRIGTPLALNDLCVLARGELGAGTVKQAMAAISRYAGDDLTLTGGRPSTGANLVWMCFVAALRGANAEDDAPLEAVRTGIDPVFPHATEGDGFHRDGSFRQHGAYAYNGGYGKSLLGNLTDLLVLLAGSPWQTASPERDNLFAWVRDAFEPLVRDGVVLDMVRGREVTRSHATGGWAGRSVTAALLRLSDAPSLTPPGTAEDLRSLVKGWITHAPYDFLRYDTASPLDVSPGLLASARALLDDPAVPARRSAAGVRVFAAMDRAVTVRPGFTLGVAMSSPRTGLFESINGENQHGWYHAVGTTVLHADGSPGHHDDAYWPTADPYRMPGTTVDTRPRADGGVYQEGGGSAWAGGAQVLGRHAAVGYEYVDGGSSLTARKSWFLIDDAVVCVGSGITAHDGRRVETVVDARNLGAAPDAVFTVDGAAQPAADGWTATREVSWTHLAGTGGYVFPGPGAPRLTMLRAGRTGRWGDVTGGRMPATDTTAHRRTYLTQYLDHGTDPAGAGYRYVLLPGATAEATAAWAAEPDVRITAASEAVHAVVSPERRLRMVTFWTDDAPATEGVAASSRCTVVVHGFTEDGEDGEDGADLVEIAVCDPTHEQTGDVVVEVRLERPATGVAEAADGVTVDGLGSGRNPTVRLTVPLAGARGATRRARLRCT